MLVEQIIKQTVDLQGFRVHTVTKEPDGLVAEIRPDTRYRIRCGTCGHPAVYRDTRDVRFFRHVPLWNIGSSSFDVDLIYKGIKSTSNDEENHEQ